MIFASITRSELFQPDLAHLPTTEGVAKLVLMSVCSNPPPLRCIEGTCETCAGGNGKELFSERLAGTLINQAGYLNEPIEFINVATGSIDLPVSEFIEV